MFTRGVHVTCLCNMTAHKHEIMGIIMHVNVCVLPPVAFLFLFVDSRSYSLSRGFRHLSAPPANA